MVRVSPKSPAKDFSIGTSKRGLDGKMWIVHRGPSGRKLWKRKVKMVKKAVKKKRAKKPTLRKRGKLLVPYAGARRAIGAAMPARRPTKCIKNRDIYTQLDGTNYQVVQPKGGRKPYRRRCYATLDDANIHGAGAVPLSLRRAKDPNKDLPAMSYANALYGGDFDDLFL